MSAVRSAGDVSYSYVDRLVSQRDHPCCYQRGRQLAAGLHPCPGRPVVPNLLATLLVHRPWKRFYRHFPRPRGSVAGFTSHRTWSAPQPDIRSRGRPRSKSSSATFHRCTTTRWSRKQSRNGCSWVPCMRPATTRRQITMGCRGAMIQKAYAFISAVLSLNSLMARAHTGLDSSCEA